MVNATGLFHNHVTKLMNAYNKCFGDNTLRQCIYNNTLKDSLLEPLAFFYHGGGSCKSGTADATVNKRYEGSRCRISKDGIRLGESFHAGFYAFFIKELLSVFRREQLLPILMLDYINDMEVTLQKTFEILGLKQLDKNELKTIIGGPEHNSGTVRKRRAEEMLYKTKSLLKQFYKPYNAEMAKLIDDKRYLFEV